MKENTNNLIKYARKKLESIAGKDKVFIDLGCGTRKKEGTIGIDKFPAPGVDIVCDIEKGIPVEDGSVDKIYTTYFLEHVSNLIFVFQEMYRVLVDGGVVELLVPYYTSINAFKDPTHKHFFTEETFKYFSREKWYGSDYGIKTDFEVVKIKYYYSKLILPWMPFKKYLRRHFMNLVGAIEVSLKAKKH